MTLTTERQQFAEQNEMSLEFVNWFFDEKKEGCGNAWFIMAAAMWEGWKGRDNREAQPELSKFYEKAWKDGYEVGVATAPPAPAVAEAVIPGGLVYSSALPEFESNDSDKVIGYHCFISGQTRSVESQEQAYADAKTVINAFRATVLQNCASDEPSIDAGLTANKCGNCASVNQPVSQGYALPESWISRDERMPKDGDVVLVFEEGGIIFCAEVDNGEFYPDEFPLVPTRGKEITHWMPLPAAPEGGNG